MRFFEKATNSKENKKIRNARLRANAGAKARTALIKNGYNPDETNYNFTVNSKGKVMVNVHGVKGVPLQIDAFAPRTRKTVN